MSLIVADENMPALSLFSDAATVVKKPGRYLTKEEVGDADTLLVRSITQVNASLLAGSAVRFVGSATIGTDHVDTAWLAEQGICFAHAPGCNAIAVAEYVLQAVLSWLVEQQKELSGTSIAVLGLGNVGRKVAQYCQALGLTVLAVDPPLAENQPQATWHNLQQALSADIITCHVPLTKTGAHATYHLLNADRLAALQPTQLLVNSSRGPVVDNKALAELLRIGKGPTTILDVWEHEPHVDKELFSLVRRGTPHIAGYSAEGKWRGTWMLHQAWQAWRGHAEDRRAMPELAPARQWHAPVQTAADVLALLRSQYCLKEDHQALEKSLSEKNPAQAFDRLRREYGQRYELAGMQCIQQVDQCWQPLLTLLGVLVPE